MESAHPFPCHDPGRAMQIASAGVVPEPRPCCEHCLLPSARERLDRRPAADEFAEISRDRGDRRLLQHDFGQPDTVGIGAFAGGRAPWQHAPVPVVPCKQNLRAFAFLFWWGGSAHNSDNGANAQRQTRQGRPPAGAPAPGPGRCGWSRCRSRGGGGPCIPVSATRRLVLRWEEIAGPEVARLARPVRYSPNQGGGVLDRSRPNRVQRFSLAMRRARSANASTPISAGPRSTGFVSSRAAWPSAPGPGRRQTRRNPCRKPTPS